MREQVLVQDMSQTLSVMGLVNRKRDLQATDVEALSDESLNQIDDRFQHNACLSKRKRVIWRAFSAYPPRRATPALTPTRRPERISKWWESHQSLALACPSLGRPALLSTDRLEQFARVPWSKETVAVAGLLESRQVEHEAEIALVILVAADSHGDLAVAPGIHLVSVHRLNGANLTARAVVPNRDTAGAVPAIAIE